MRNALQNVKAFQALRGLQIAGRHLAGLGVALKIVGDFLAFGDFTHARSFDGGDVNESINPAIVRLDKAETFGGIEPFNCASGHNEPLQ